MTKKKEEKEVPRFTTGVNLPPLKAGDPERRFEEGDPVPDDLTPKERKALKDAIEE